MATFASAAANPLPPAVIILDHSNPIDFNREAMPLLGKLVKGFLHDEAERAQVGSSELASDTATADLLLAVRPAAVLAELEPAVAA